MRSLTLPKGDANCSSISALMFHPAVCRRELAGRDLLQAFFHGTLFAPGVALVGGAADYLLGATFHAVAPRLTERALMGELADEGVGDLHEHVAHAAASSLEDSASASLSSAAMSLSTSPSTGLITTTSLSLVTSTPMRLRSEVLRSPSAFLSTAARGRGGGAAG